MIEKLSALIMKDYNSITIFWCIVGMISITLLAVPDIIISYFEQRNKK